MSPIITRVAGAQGGITNNSGFRRAYLGRGVVGIASVIPRSLRFNSPDSTHLTKNLSSGNRNTFTWAGWVKRVKLDGTSPYAWDTFLNGHSDTSNYTTLGTYSNNTDQWGFVHTVSGSQAAKVYTTSVQRDVSAWYHVVISVDSTQSTPSNRVKIYINGVDSTDTSGSTYPSQSTNFYINHNISHYIGVTYPSFQSSGVFSNCYLTDIHFIDGQALTPSSFGFLDSNGVWQPSLYSGTYGTNGFKLNFADSSNNTATTLGKDAAGSNNWTPVNFSTRTSSTTYSNTGSVSRSGYVVGNPINMYDGKVNFGDNVWGAIQGTQTQSNISIGFSTSIKVYYNVNIDGGTISLNGSSKAANTPPGGNTTVGTLDWTGQISSPVTSISFSSPSDGQGTYVLGIEADGVIVTDSWFLNKYNDCVVDSPTNGIQSDTGIGNSVTGGYTTLNSLDNPSSVTLLNGNLSFSHNAASFKSIRATHMMKSGKWYFEMINMSGGGMLGIARPTDSVSSHLGSVSNAGIGFGNVVTYKDGGSVSHNNTFSYGDRLGCAFDADAGNVWFRYNGTWVSSGDPAAGTNAVYTGLTDGTWMPAVTTYDNASYPHFINFGQQPFDYAAPSGFKCLCTSNLSNTTITTSGTFTGNAGADGPFVYLNGVPTAMTINGNAVTFGTHADKLANGFKVRTSSSSYNTSGSNSYTITTTGGAFKTARAQTNP